VTKSNRKINFRLILITDRKLCRNLPEKISQACNAGLKAVLVREKDISRAGLNSLVGKILTITTKSNTKLLIHTGALKAFLSGADGYHLPEKELLHLHTTKKKIKLISGISVHSVKNAVRAEKLGFDYILFGPVFRTPEKIKYGPPQGRDKLKEVCSSVNIPVFAVGGITPKRIKKCLDSGAHGVAAIRQFMTSQNIKRTVKEYERELGSL
jgi:thiamine-phosphate pyrophosphorylase